MPLAQAVAEKFPQLSWPVGHAQWVLERVAQQHSIDPNSTKLSRISRVPSQFKIWTIHAQNKLFVYDVEGTFLQGSDIPKDVFSSSQAYAYLYPWYNGLTQHDRISNTIIYTWYNSLILFSRSLLILQLAMFNSSTFITGSLSLRLAINGKE